MSREKCPNCGNLLVKPAGPESSRILLMGEFPGVDELRMGVPFVGMIGDIVRRELARAGVQMVACRATNLWQHGKNEKGCILDWHINRAALELKGKKYVLAMGSEVTRAFFGVNVMDVSGLVLKSKVYPDVIFMACPNPAILLHAPVGEFRLALRKFEELVNA